MGKIFQGVLIAWIVFITQDYIRFRFSPPYVTKDMCNASHQAANLIADERAKGIKDLGDRMENRMDRLEGLLMVALTNRKMADHDG